LQSEATVLRHEAAVLQREATALRREATMMQLEATILQREATMMQLEATILQHEATALQREATVVQHESECGMSQKKLWAQKVARLAWHLLRYLTATGVSILAIATLPLIAVLALTLLSTALVFFFFIGGVMDAGLPLALIVNGATLLVVLALGVGSGLVLLLLITIFAVLGLLPVALLTELVCQRLSLRSTLARLASFLIAGLCLGIPLAGSIFLFKIQTHLLILLALFVAILLICTCAEFLFGLILTTMSIVKDSGAGLWRTAGAFKRWHRRLRYNIKDPPQRSGGR